MTQYEFESTFGYQINRLNHALERCMNAILLPFHLTYSQWQVLVWLKCSATQSQTELASKMHIEPPTLAGILDRMERDGWLHREQDPDDRRRNILRIDPRVDAHWESLQDSYAALEAKALSGIHEEDLAVAKRVILRMLRNLGVALNGLLMTIVQ
jgi:MarR family transcriptional regulator for hemolysin